MKHLLAILLASLMPLSASAGWSTLVRTSMPLPTESEEAPSSQEEGGTEVEEAAPSRREELVLEAGRRTGGPEGLLHEPGAPIELALLRTTPQSGHCWSNGLLAPLTT